jgi:hypothetical protein
LSQRVFGILVVNFVVWNVRDFTPVGLGVIVTETLALATKQEQMPALEKRTLSPFSIDFQNTSPHMGMQNIPVHGPGYRSSEAKSPHLHPQLIAFIANHVPLSSQDCSLSQSSDSRKGMIGEKLQLHCMNISGGSILS